MVGILIWRMGNFLDHNMEVSNSSIRKNLHDECSRMKIEQDTA